MDTPKQLKRRTCMIIPAILLLLLHVNTGYAQEDAKTRLTIQNVFASGLLQPGVELLDWLPDGNSFLYILGGQIWRYDAGSGEAAALTSLQEIQTKLMQGRTPGREVASDVDVTGRFDRSAVTLSPDGNTLLGVHDNDIYLYVLESGEGRFLTDDPEAESFQTFSPDGTRVAYVKEKDIWYVDLRGGEQVRLTDDSDNDDIWNGVADWVYEEELVVRRSFWWAPTSDRIAFLQFDTSPLQDFTMIDFLQLHPEPLKQRFPLAGGDNSIVKLAVIALDSRELTWIDTGEERDIYLPRVKWNSSGSKLAYIWMNRDQSRFELRFADPSTGRSRTAFAEERDTWVNFESSTLFPRVNWIFLRNDSFLFASERSGFRHLYLFDSEGGLLRQLTDGSWEVVEIDGLSEDEQIVYFTASEKSPIESHLYSVRTDGTGFQRVTERKGVHDTRISPSGEYFLRTHSSGRIPPSTAVFGADGSEVYTLFESQRPDTDRWAVSYPEFLTIEADDGTPLHATIMKPPGFDPAKKYPVIVYVYGGPGVQTVVDSWNLQMLLVGNIIAARDYIVFALDNRGSLGRGHAFEAPLYRNLGSVEVEDQVAGVEFLRTLPYVEADNIGITGGSYGGYMTMLCLFKAPDHFKAGVAQFPGTRWEHYDTIYTERYMDKPQDNPEGYENGAASKYAANLKGHLYIQAGMMDNNAHVQQTFDVIEALLVAGKDFKLMLYPQAGHGANQPHYFFHSFTTMLDFFDEHMKR